VKNSIVAIATVAIYGSALFIFDQGRQRPMDDGGSIIQGDVDSEVVGRAVHANGWIEGRFEAVELRARISEQITGVHVARGQRVSANEELISLDALSFIKERDLAAAMHCEALARKNRIENGFRDSEIETARQEFLAANARKLGIEKVYLRTQRLVEQGAESRQRLDDLDAEMAMLRALTLAAQGRLDTHQQPPREDDIVLADAVVRAAKAKLDLAQIQLDRTRIVAPFDGQVLAVDAKLGELTGPEDDRPLIVLADTSTQRAVAEVDEFDVLSVQIGQKCQISADAAPGVIARGMIVEIEPRMQPKQRFAHRVGERNDTFSRRVWIDLDAKIELPIGLPVNVSIAID